MILVLIHILITVVIGAIVFRVIDRYVPDRRLTDLLKLASFWCVSSPSCSGYCRRLA
jgi:hypothetical protein